MKRLLQKDRSKSEWVGLQNGSRTCYDVWFGSDATDKKTGGRAEGPFPLGVTSTDNIRNDHIRGTAQVDCFGDEAEQVCTWMLTMKSPGTRKRGRPHRTFIDVVMEDMLV